MEGVPRPPREELAGGIHHVFARGNAKQVIYVDDADRQRYLVLLGRAVARHRWRCLAYCLMDNHVHLLVETPAPNLGRGMQWLHSLYAQTFNERYSRVGHLFQGRFGAVRMKSDAQLLLVARYIARNPVEGGLCGEPGEWSWSSHATAFSDRERPPWLDTPRLFDFFGAGGGDSRRRYADFVALR
jgi:REP element-mobilizing transposase RayT